MKQWVFTTTRANIRDYTVAQYYYHTSAVKNFYNVYMYTTVLLLIIGASLSEPHIVHDNGPGSLIVNFESSNSTWSAMGKEKKQRGLRTQSLTQQILSVGAPRASSRVKTRKLLTESKEKEEYVGDRLSKKILDEVRVQQEELEEECGVSLTAPARKKVGYVGNLGATRGSLLGKGVDSESEDGSDEEELDVKAVSADLCPEVNREDERAMQLFMNPQQPERKSLADIVMEKIREKQTEIASQTSDQPSVAFQIDPRVVSMFKGVGQILAKYRSGKLPKAFKVIPSLSNWEEILYLTEPDNWSASSMYQAARIFTSNLSSVKAQRFFNLVLLPRVRDDIREYKRLNFHLYAALRKALFKPAAFFKGLLLPLCESGTCTLREALIISSVLAKTSIPMLHSSAALLKIAEMDYSGANSIFIRALLDKKYALPYRVIDAITFHFLKFQHDHRPLPVLWHQALLAFVQRYKEDLSLEQKEGLLELLKTKSHHGITPEVRREIVNSKCRDIGDVYMNKTNTQ